MTGSDDSTSGGKAPADSAKRAKRSKRKRLVDAMPVPPGALSSRILGALFFLVGMVEVYSILPPRNLPQPPPARPAPYRQGVLHVHSTFSDGGGTPDEIGEAASQAGLDFVILTDHNNARARAAGFEKTYGKSDLFVEMEATTPAGHALFFFSHTDAVSLSDETVAALAWKHFLSNDTNRDAFLAVAHPSNVKNPWTHLDRFPDGMEVVNFDSVWQRQLSESFTDFATMAVIDPFNNFLGALRFFEVYKKDFTAWDGMNAVSRGHFAVLAQDTHAKIIVNKSVSVRWPDYLETFKLASNIVYYDEPLATDFTERKRQLYASIRGGRLALTYQAVYPFAGNDWRLECGDRRYRAGDEAAFERGKCQFLIDTPPGLPYGRILRIVKNGEPYKEITDAGSTAAIPVDGEGVYRLEVWVKAHTLTRILLNRPVPYVFYNPIYIR